MTQESNVTAKRISAWRSRYIPNMFSFLKKIQFFLLLTLLIDCQSFEEVMPQEKIFGITIDDSWYEDTYIDNIVEAIKQMPRKPTLRVVMSREKHPVEYVEMFKKLHKVAYIMATPVDSYEMIHYRSVEGYRKRFEESYKSLGNYVDFWEIGNEINGEDWLGRDRQLIVDKMIAAFEFITASRGKTVLTAYYTKPQMQQVEMLDWLRQNVPSFMKKKLDYLFVSYYEDDNESYQPSWQKIFSALEKEFPSVKLGIGECGSTDPNASIEEKITKARQYYSMPTLTKNYVGGYFWWYWVQDCIPYENNRLYQAINEAFLE